MLTADIANMRLSAGARCPTMPSSVVTPVPEMPKPSSRPLISSSVPLEAAYIR